MCRSSWASAESFAPFGVNGGATGGAQPLRRTQTDDGRMATAAAGVSKVTDVHIRRRARSVRLETPGGGGFGDPAARAPARVVRDVRLGYVSRAAAERDYQVVLHDDGSLDSDATAKLRGHA